MTSDGRHGAFLSTGMTPRAWRMLAYSAVGFCVYGLVFVMETAQNAWLARTDRQLQQIAFQESLGEDPFEAAASSPASTPKAPAAELRGRPATQSVETPDAPVPVEPSE